MLLTLKAIQFPNHQGESNKLDSGLHYVVGDNNKIINSEKQSSIIFGALNEIDSKNNLPENVKGNNIAGSSNSIKGTNNNVFGSANSIKGDENLAIGNNSDVRANNSVSIGQYSYNERDNTVSFGNKETKRQLTNIGNGTEDYDAVNVKQLNQKAQAAIDSANRYTDGKIIDTKNEAINTSNMYTDNRFNALNNQINQRINQLDNKIDRVEKQTNAGIAGVTAIASIPYSTSENFSFGMGVGHYQNGKAIAAGAQYKIADNANVRVNIAWDNTDNASVGAGLAIGW
ncbi:YadA-like family protein [Arsenophonus nasoniae]|uniref:Adhesin YadA n=1 Tax=Arsenophonus nasoniae TaxID=638 RepID=A0A4P7L2D2_9GAMM|nr:YadA-like family protein [Arsenophonus nasoniae]QBY46887.1 Adhesin YadA [Arsenophonus nasoniae]